MPEPGDQVSTYPLPTGCHLGVRRQSWESQRVSKQFYYNRESSSSTWRDASKFRAPPISSVLRGGRCTIGSVRVIKNVRRTKQGSLATASGKQRGTFLIPRNSQTSPREQLWWSRRVYRIRGCGPFRVSLPQYYHTPSFQSVVQSKTATATEEWFSRLCLLIPAEGNLPGRGLAQYAYVESFKPTWINTHCLSEGWAGTMLL